MPKVAGVPPPNAGRLASDHPNRLNNHQATWMFISLAGFTINLLYEVCLLRPPFPARKYASRIILERSQENILVFRSGNTYRSIETGGIVCYVLPYSCYHLVVS